MLSEGELLDLYLRNVHWQELLKPVHGYQQPTTIMDFGFSNVKEMEKARAAFGEVDFGIERPYFLELGPGKFAVDMSDRLKIGLNKEADPGCNIYWDLNYGIPLPDETVRRIHSGQVLEHIDNLIYLMNECWRVLIPGGQMWHGVPYHLGPHSWGDPTHVRAFTENSFRYFCQSQNGVPFAESFTDYGIECSFVLHKQEIKDGNQGLEVWMNKPE